jgi:hypothetical protein
MKSSGAKVHFIKRHSESNLLQGKFAGCAGPLASMEAEGVESFVGLRAASAHWPYPGAIGNLLNYLQRYHFPEFSGGWRPATV